VGVAEVVREAYPEPAAGGRSCVDLAPREPLPAPVTLAELKGERAFAASPLVKQGRLSVVPLDEAQWTVLLARAAKASPAPRARGDEGRRRAKVKVRKPAPRGKTRTHPRATRG
jgi:hypothetical protein